MRAVELFSGIGGWSLSLMKSRALSAEVVAAFDVNPEANAVYAFNFGRQPLTRNLETLSAESLDELSAELLMMSPPCQPFTRSNCSDRRDCLDPRSKAFLNIVDQLGRMHRPPTYIALENVVGFESSDCCARFLAVLRDRGYHFQQYHLTPTQLGVPNDRPRYYCIARLHRPFDSEEHPNRVLTSFPKGDADRAPLAVSAYLDSALSSAERSALCIPEHILSKSAAWCFDIVTPSDTRTSCFTKAYAKFIKGSGSVLFEPSDGATTLSNIFLCDPATRVFDTEWRRKLDGGTLRYFSPSELLRLFGFSDTTEFRFPREMSNRKCFELLGNSLNVFITTELLNLLFS